MGHPTASPGPPSDPRRPLPKPVDPAAVDGAPRRRPATRHRSPPPRHGGATSSPTSTTTGQTSTSPPRRPRSILRPPQTPPREGTGGTISPKNKNLNMVRRRLLRNLLDRDLPRRNHNPRRVPNLPPAQPAIRGLRRHPQHRLPRRRLLSQRRRLPAGEFHESQQKSRCRFREPDRRSVLRTDSNRDPVHTTVLGGEGRIEIRESGAGDEPSEDSIRGEQEA
ncbi:hypothetical protein LINPERPRIM_LOCUS22826 [Linum perenne]